jgi:hypothetical protein
MRHLATVLLLTSLSIAAATNAYAGQRGPAAQAQACGCADATELASRLRGIEAAIKVLDSQAAAQSRQRFNADTFDSGLGESILMAQMQAGGIGAAIPAADFDRFSCEITTIDALGGSACAIRSLNAQFSSRQQVCRQSRKAPDDGTDYWEGRMMSDVIRELRASYVAEAAFIDEQTKRLASSCGSSAAPPPPANCRNCLQYILEGTLTLPLVGTLRMVANSAVPFAIASNGTITGQGTIVTTLDMSGSPCTVSRYNPRAPVRVTGQITGNVLNVVITPQAGPGFSAGMTIRCPPGGVAHNISQSETYAVQQQLQLPAANRPYSEESIDLATRTRGAMNGRIILRLYVTQ